MKKILLIVILMMSVWSVDAQAPKIEWSKCYGGSQTDLGYSISSCSDGGYILAGNSYSNNGDLTGNYGQSDYWVVKTDKKGNIKWQRNYGGTLSDYATKVIETKDNGYLLAGESTGGLGNKTCYKSNNDIWLVKLDSTGNIQWQKCFGCSFVNYFGSIIQTKDSSYVLVGSVTEKSGDVGSSFHGNNIAHNSDLWVVKLSKLGVIVWEKCFGGANGESATSINQTSDDGYIIGGATRSTDGDVSGYHTSLNNFYDAWIIKINSTGTLEWQKCLGGSESENVKDIIQTSDFGYIAVMESNSNNGDITDNHLRYNATTMTYSPTSDYWIVRLDYSGNIIWKKSYGGDNSDNPEKILQTFDGNFIVAGSSASGSPYYGDVKNNYSGFDYWIFKINPNGKLLWEKNFGGGGNDYCKSILINNDGLLISNGSTTSTNKDVTNIHNSAEMWTTQLTKEFYPTMQGYIFTDHNSNSIKETLEPYKSNVKVQLSNGNYTFTDNNGFYQIQADSIGAYTLTVTSPNLYNAQPQTLSYNFKSWDTVVTQNIALQPTVVKDSVYINVLPMVMNAVQGGAMPYYVSYDNAGTTLLSPLVSLTYNNYLLAYDSCTDATAVATANGIVTGEPNMQPGKRNNFVSYFTVKPSANIGDTLTTIFSITSPNASQTDSIYMIVEGGSPSPDAQRATPSLTDAQVAAGKEIVYSIGFKNTGNDTAYNVVITDTLSNLLQANTLQMVASSHPCKTTVKGNLVTFELLNIKLPKASSNALKSIGFVSFKIKPKNNLTAGTIITNKANTYYNYRAPQSSIATTIIKAVVTPLTMLNVKCWMLNVKNVKNVAVNWATANEINVSHFNVQRSINNKDFINIGKVSANNISFNEYGYVDYSVQATVDGKLYYRIESIDRDGRKQYSEIKNVTLGNRDEGLSIYPNPAKDVVTVETKGAKALQIVDGLGRIIIEKKIINNQSTTINVQEFLKGIYVVKMVMNNNTTLLSKFIKQ